MVSHLTAVLEVRGSIPANTLKCFPKFSILSNYYCCVMDLVELRDEEYSWQCGGIFGAGGSLGRRLLPRPRRPLSGTLPTTGGLPRVSPVPATPVRGLRQTALLLQTPPPTQLRHCKSQHCFHIAIFSLNRSFQNRYFAENLFLQALLN